jgi:hypothetical protein
MVPALWMFIRLYFFKLACLEGGPRFLHSFLLRWNFSFGRRRLNTAVLLNE